MNVQPKASRDLHTRAYIGPEHQLVGPTLDHEQAALLVVDELHKLWLTFRHTHERSDMLAFIERAVYLQRLGFELVLSKRRDCVCAHRKETPNVH